jgi:glyoxylase-like metal-dependent hydrolase (beta-lactamase superfamily II)
MPERPSSSLRGRPSRPLAQRRELGRADRVLPGLWRLRLPLPWPGVPHGNAYAIAAGDGVVLVDTGYYEPGSVAQLERALAQAGLRLDDVRLLVCTHAHSDHYGMAGAILEAAGCQLWMHPNHAHMTRAAQDPERFLERRIEVGRQSGVPLDALRRYEESRKGEGLGVASIAMPDRDLLPGVEVETDLGTWQVYETPGHAPSHVCLHQPDRGLLLSGDHLLGRVSLFYDYGWTPDPAGEFLNSLEVVGDLDVSLILAGHGRPVRDHARLVRANREAVHERMGRVREALRPGPRTAYDVIPDLMGVAPEELTAPLVTWGLSEALCYLRHLQLEGAAEPVDGEDPERWRLA